MDEQSVKLYKASESVRDWFTDHWQQIAEVLVACDGLEGCYIDLQELRELTKGLKIKDPTSRLAELDGALNAWHGRPLEDGFFEAASPAELKDPDQLLRHIVLLNAGITVITTRIHLGIAKPSELDTLLPMLNSLAGLLKVAAPRQD